MPEFIKQLDSYREGQLSDALIEGFLKFDLLLLESDVKEVLQELADAADKDDNNDEQQVNSSSFELFRSITTNNENEELNADETQLLKKEAELPIEELLKNYGNNGKQFQSPMILKRLRQTPSDNNDNETMNKNLQEQLVTILFSFSFFFLLKNSIMNFCIFVFIEF